MTNAERRKTSMWNKQCNSHNSTITQITDVGRSVKQTQSVNAYKQRTQWRGTTLLGRPLQLTVAKFRVNLLAGDYILRVRDACIADFVRARLDTQLYGYSCVVKLVCFWITVPTTQPSVCTLSLYLQHHHHSHTISMYSVTVPTTPPPLPHYQYVQYRSGLVETWPTAARQSPGLNHTVGSCVNFVLKQWNQQSNCHNSTITPGQITDVAFTSSDSHCDI